MLRTKNVPFWKLAVARSTNLYTSVRTHMNHGGGGGGGFVAPPPPQMSGPRQPLELGFDAAKVYPNVLRLLESSHGIHNYSQTMDMNSPAWHSKGLSWSFGNDGNSNNKNSNDYHPHHHDHSHQHEHHHHHHHHNHQDAVPDETQGNSWSPRPYNQVPAPKSLQGMPTMSWIQFSDDRTALAKLRAMDGTERYISLLRVEDTKMQPGMSSGMLANDGWVIVRELICPNYSTPLATASPAQRMIELTQCLESYFHLEHGGGMEDYVRGKELFAPEASLLSVGISPTDEPPTDWTAPVGCFLEISLDTYLGGVQNQIPHDSPTSRTKDAIIQLDCSANGMAAAATVSVGNGEQTLVFVDHLLLGRQADGSWKILSKTFSSQKWQD